MINHLHHTCRPSIGRRGLLLAAGAAGLAGVLGVPAASAGAAGLHPFVDATSPAGGRAVVHAATDVSCDSGALVAELNRINRTEGGVLSLAAGCTYTFTGPEVEGTTAQDRGGAFPVIDKPITIVGNGSTLVNGGPRFRIFTVAPGGELRLQDVTVQGGRVGGPGECEQPGSGEPGPGDGGGILVLPGGRLDVAGGGIVKNEACRGGGLANFGEATLRDTVVSRNRAFAAGGGIYNAGELTVQHSRVGSNTAKGAGTGGADGGGIANDEGGVAIITFTEITGNRATGNGGGVFHSGALATIRNSVFTVDIGSRSDRNTRNLHDRIFKGNHARQGGAIYNDTGSVLQVSDSKIIGNSAGTIIGAGGIYNRNGTVDLDRDTWIKLNVPRNCVNVAGCRY